jgi:flagellar hook-associated protein 3 FlgL
MENVKLRRENLFSINQRIATQKKIQKGSDDPIGFARSNRHRQAYEQNNQFISNVENAIGWVETTNLNLDQLYEYAVEAKTIALQAVNSGSNNGEARAALAVSVKTILNEAVSVANTQYMGKSIFSGDNTKNDEPFELSGTTVLYTGNDGAIIRETSENMRFQMNTSGQEIFDTNIFQGLEALIIAMEADDIPGIEAAMDTVDAAKEELLTIASAQGSFRTSLSLIEDRLLNSNLKLMEYISDDEDAVLEEEFLHLKSEETAYQAALQASAEVMQMNILQYL